MNDRDFDQTRMPVLQFPNELLLFAGLLYSVMTFAFIFGASPSFIGFESFFVLVYMFAPSTAISLMVIVHNHGGRFHAAAMVVYVVWILFTVFLQFLLLCLAYASV